MAAKRAFKLQEFVAHGANVNCLHVGRKSGQVLVTGGEDRKVNMWAIGKPNAILSLAGHSTAVECVSFDQGEEVVVAGSAGGSLKLWDLEQGKVVRTLTGHRSNCVCVDFHPFGEYIASGSLDTNLKVWDIRKKNCIQTYKGHQGGIRHIRFSPDGRWVVSGGEDGVVKLWDLTAGKLIHDFTTHVGPVTALDFHPNEFLLATGSADRAVKFWDLETFGQVSSTFPETTPIRAVTFTPDGRVLLAASHEGLNVWSWEPLECIDHVDVSWSRLADLNIASDQLVGCSFNQTFVGVWVVNLQKVAPFCQEGDPDYRQVTEALEKLRAQHAQRGGTRLQENTHINASPPSATHSDGEPSNGSPAPEAHDPVPARPALSERSRSVPHSRPSEDSKPGPQRGVRRGESGSGSGSGSSSGRAGPSRVPARSPRENETNTDTNRGRPFSRHSPQGGNVPQPQIFVPPTMVQLPPGGTKARHDPNQPVMAPTSPLDGDPFRNIPATSAPTRLSIIPAPKDRPIGLDPSEFLPKKANDEAALTDDRILEEVMGAHSTMCGILSTRLTNVRVLRSLWGNSDVKGALDALTKIHDPALTVDFLNYTRNRMSVFTLDLCVLLLPLVAELFSSQFEDYIVTACEAVKSLHKAYGGLIRGTREKASGRGGVGPDVVMEERLEKCNHAYEGFVDCRERMKPLLKRPARIGRVTREVFQLLGDLVGEE